MGYFTIVDVICGFCVGIEYADSETLNEEFDDWYLIIELGIIRITIQKLSD